VEEDGLGISSFNPQPLQASLLALLQALLLALVQALLPALLLALVRP
jgi:hypothetical protein